MKKLARFLCFLLTAVLLCATLASCSGEPAATADEAIAALKDAGYTLTVENAEHELKAYAALGAAGVTCVITAREADEVAYLYYFADEAAATAALDAVKTLAADAKAVLAEGVEWVEPAVYGAVICFGSADAVADAN